jgi:4-amino-4-deoxy-L-arabinose transferase-like glycosyltransferase
MTALAPTSPPNVTPIHGAASASRHTVPALSLRRAAATYRHWLVYPTLAVIIGLFSYTLAGYWVGAHPGVDQAGYLTTARLMLQDHSLYFRPESPFQFVSRMMITTEDGREFAKYPPGFPLLAAIGRVLAGPDGMYMVNPICAVIACLAAFFMFRTLVREFVALMGVILLASNPLTLIYADDANSHASSLCCVCVGFWLLLSWMRNGTWWKGLLGGFALGYACTIRYSEFLLVLPVTFASLSTVGIIWKRKEMTVRRFIDGLAPLLGWAIPIAALALTCWISFGLPWKTGYTYCKEDAGFSLKYFFGDPWAVPTKPGNWETFIQQINHMGLFFLWPLSLIGLVGLPRRHWRVAITLALWILPSMTLYLCYYWAPGGENTVGYLRFFLTVIPGLLLAALWVIDRAVRHVHNANITSLVAATIGCVLFAAGLIYLCQPPEYEAFTWRAVIIAAMAALVLGVWFVERDIAGRHFASALAIGVVTIGTAFINLWNITPNLENATEAHVALRETVAHVQQAVAPDNNTILFTDENLCNQFDCLGGYRLYSVQLFSPLAFAMFKHVMDDPGKQTDPQTDPNPLQRDRARFYVELLGRKNALGNWAQRPADEIRRDQLSIIDTALIAHRRVVFLLRAEQGKTPIPIRSGLQIKQLATWVTTPPVSPPIAPRWLAWRDRNDRPPVVAPKSSWVLYEITGGEK